MATDNRPRVAYVLPDGTIGNIIFDEGDDHPEEISFTSKDGTIGTAYRAPQDREWCETCGLPIATDADGDLSIRDTFIPLLCWSSRTVCSVEIDRLIDRAMREDQDPPTYRERMDDHG